MPPIITLAPLTLADHIEAVQLVYRAAPGFWGMHGLLAAPEGQAQQDLREAEETPGRTIMGIVRRLIEDEPAAGHEMVGVVDFRLHWPREKVCYVGMLMVAEEYQRQGIGARTLALLEPWLASSASVETIRLGIEQFNTVALRFFQHAGFAITGETSRIRVDDKWVRLLYMEKALAAPGTASESS